MARFIVIDGLDGCGKATQTKLLKDKLIEMGKRVVKLTFPKYDSDSSAAVRMYLNRELGSDPEKLNPYICGTFYAIDRAIQYIQDWSKYFNEDDNTIIVADRYLSANIIHQGGKIEDRKERLNYASWCYSLECGLYDLPKEDLAIILTINPEISQKLILNRYNGDETKKDIHESNIKYLNDCYYRLNETINDINGLNIAKWVRIDCENNGTIDTVENIHSKVVDAVSKYTNITFG